VAHFRFGSARLGSARLGRAWCGAVGGVLRGFGWLVGMFRPHSPPLVQTLPERHVGHRSCECSIQVRYVDVMFPWFPGDHRVARRRAPEHERVLGQRMPRTIRVSGQP
jgi:hypothetical protein